MNMTRRGFLAAGLAGLPTLPALAAEPRSRLGVVAYSFAVRLGLERKRGVKQGLADPLVFLEHCHQLGAGGIQVSLGVREKQQTAKLREKAEGWGMFVEGVVRVPEGRGDIDRFDAEVRTAREAGVRVLRTALLSGRRYETFDTAAAFRKWADRAFASLALAEPVVARHDVRLAVENHKDWRVPDLVGLMKRIDSRHVGICVDTGNSIALLEDPLEVVKAYAPWAFSTHLKDVAVAEYEDGFLLAEVPLGTGILDLDKMVGLLRRARPEVHFNLEMITRDPLRIPCLTPKYWAVMDGVPGRDLARTLTLVRKHKSARLLPDLRSLSAEQQLVAEEDNVRKSLTHARERLGL